jgi:MATE family multidrug resistance protein
MLLNMSHMFYGAGAIDVGALFRPRKACLGNLLRLGTPGALQQTAWNAGTLVVYFLVGSSAAGQVTALAAMSGGVRIEAVVFLPIFAMNMAASVLTGNRLGAKDMEGAGSAAKATAALSLCITLIPAASIFIFAPELAASLTQDAAVSTEMIRYLRINMLGMPFLALGITLAGAMQGAGDTFGTMRIVFTGMWLLRIPTILFVIHILRMDAEGIWWTMTGSIICMCLLFIVRFRGKKWMYASVNKATNSMMWESCLGKTDGKRSES